MLFTSLSQYEPLALRPHFHGLEYLSLPPGATLSSVYMRTLSPHRPSQRPSLHDPGLLFTPG